VVSLAWYLFRPESAGLCLHHWRLISAFFTIKTYYAKRKEERERLDEEKRTQLLASYLADVSAKPGGDRPASAEVVTEALKRIASDTQG
jgi:hypothetical protein